MLITLQYCIGFAIHQHESTTAVHVFPILNPAHTSLPISSLWVIPVHQPQASCILHRTWTGDLFLIWYSVQFSSVAQSCPTLCDPMNHSTPGLPVHHQFPEFTQTQVHRVSDAVQPSHPLSSPSPPAPNPSQHQSLFQWVNSSHEVAK